jgi:hypothetical protein
VGICELSVYRLRERLYAYRRSYPALQRDNDFQSILDGLEPAPQADQLMSRFLRQAIAVSP